MFITIFKSVKYKWHTNKHIYIFTYTYININPFIQLPFTENLLYAKHTAKKFKYLQGGPSYL